MKKGPFLFASLLMLALAGCKSTETPAPSSGLEGTWRLTSRQCYCTPKPVPDETVTLTATRFAFYSGNRAMRLGEYSLVTAAVPCINNGSTGPALHLTYSAATTSPGPPDIQYRLDGNTLTLDYGSPCDAPIDTYERLQ